MVVPRKQITVVFSIGNEYCALFQLWFDHPCKGYTSSFVGNAAINYESSPNPLKDSRYQIKYRNSMGSLKFLKVGLLEKINTHGLDQVF